MTSLLSYLIINWGQVGKNNISFLVTNSAHQHKLYSSYLNNNFLEGAIILIGL